MARSFDQILAEVTSKSDPQRNIVLNQISQLPGQQKAEESGLEAKKDQAFGDILGGARRRGLGFSGIPLAEQAQYTASDYAPALANLKSSFNSRKSSLESALADIGKQDYGTAQDIFARDRAFEEQVRQFNEEQALRKQQLEAERAASASSGLPGSLFGGGGDTPASAQMQQRGDKGFNFQDASGRAISAAQYAQLKRIPFRSLLQQMANAGDNGAKQALGYVGDDYGVNKRKLGNLLVSPSQYNNTRNVLNSILGGVNRI